MPIFSKQVPYPGGTFVQNLLNLTVSVREETCLPVDSTDRVIRQQGHLTQKADKDIID